MSQEPKSNKPSPIMAIFANIPKTFKRGAFKLQNNSNLVIDMILNNMKIEGQEVSRESFLKLIDKNQAGS